MTMKKTSISIPEEILDAIQKYNDENPYSKINRSEECSGALAKKLIEVGITLRGQ